MHRQTVRGARKCGDDERSEMGPMEWMGDCRDHVVRSKTLAVQTLPISRSFVRIAVIK